MELAELQRQVHQLARDAFPDDYPGTADGLIARAVEELGELAQALRKHEGARFGHPKEHRATYDDVIDELGDLLFMVVRLANLKGMSLEWVALNVLNKIERRVDDEDHA